MYAHTNMKIIIERCPPYLHRSFLEVSVALKQSATVSNSLSWLGSTVAVFVFDLKQQHR